MNLPFTRHRHAPVQTAYMDVDTIEDATVRLAGGQLRAVLEAGGANFWLAGEQEQRAFVDSYASVLNSIDFPFQFCIQVRPVDLSAYLSSLEQVAQSLPPRLAALARDHAAFLRKLARSRTLLERHVYVVVPGPERSSLASPGLFRWWPFSGSAAVQEHDRARAQLAARCDELAHHFSRCGITVRRLGDRDLAGLYAGYWCPDLARRQRVQTMLSDYQALAVRASYPAPQPPQVAGRLA